MSTALLLLSTALAAQVPADALRGYGEVLQKHVSNGRVSYKKLAAEDLPKLDAFVKAIATMKVPSDKKAALALYADAYNALVIRAVITEKIPRSVLDVNGFFDAKKHTVAGKSMTLNELEKGLIMPLAKPDPRPHMLLVCAAVGCPILENKPLSGSNYDARAAAATRRYLASPRGAIVGDGEVKLSKIFDWYQADFGGQEGVIRFVRDHLPPEQAKKLGDKPKISYIDYNWTLNQQ